MKTYRRACTLMLTALAACDGGPTGPGGGSGTGSDPLPAGAPTLPVPAGPLADVPGTSDTLTVITAVTADFFPRVNRARGDWNVEVCLPFQPCFSDDPTDTWSDELPPTGGIPVALQPVIGRILLVEEGIPEAPTQAAFSSVLGFMTLTIEHDFQGPALAGTVHLRRDRYWERQALSSGVGEYLLLSGDTEATLETTYSSGTSTTQTEEFGQSLTAEVGLGIGPLSASLSGTLSETFSTSVEVREDRSESFSRTVRGSPGAQTRFMVWILTERYTFTDEDGVPFTDPAYDLVADTLFRRGVATALQATDFPLP